MSSAELRCSISSTKCHRSIVPTRSSLPSNSSRRLSKTILKSGVNVASRLAM